MKPKNRVLCPDCGRPKILFESENKANNFIKFNAEEIPHGHRLRSYYCPACCGWHVSSHEYDGINRTELLLENYRKSKQRPKVVKPTSPVNSIKRSKYSPEILQSMHDIAAALKCRNLSTRNELKFHLKRYLNTFNLNERFKGCWCKLVCVCYEDLNIK